MRVFERLTVAFIVLPFCALLTVEPTVIRNDEISWSDLKPRLDAGEFHNIVISPGPGTPEREADIGMSQAF
jgi:anthranilate/para-aminobenzoate synthase component II